MLSYLKMNHVTLLPANHWIWWKKNILIQDDSNDNGCDTGNNYSCVQRSWRVACWNEIICWWIVDVKSSQRISMFVSARRLLTLFVQFSTWRDDARLFVSFESIFIFCRVQKPFVWTLFLEITSADRRHGPALGSSISCDTQTPHLTLATGTRGQHWTIFHCKHDLCPFFFYFWCVSDWGPKMWAGRWIVTGHLSPESSLISHFVEGATRRWCRSRYLWGSSVN